MWAYLPKELVSCVIEWSDLDDILSLTTVTKQWSLCAHEEKVWEGLFSQTFKDDDDDDDHTQGWKAKFSRRFRIDRNWMWCEGRDVAEIEERFKTMSLEGHTSYVNCTLLWSSSGLLFSGSQDDTIRVWSLTSGECLGVLDEPTSAVFHLSGDEKSNMLVSANRRSVQVWRASEGVLLHTLHVTDLVESLAVLSSGIIVVGQGQGHVSIWDVSDGKLVKTLSGGGGSHVWSLVADKKRVVTGDAHGVVRIFSLETGACTKVLFRAQEEVCGLALRKDILVASCTDGRIWSWDLSVETKNSNRREFEVSESATFYSILWPRQQSGRVIGYDGKGIKVWNVETGKVLTTIHTVSTDSDTVSTDLHRLVYSAMMTNVITVLDFSV
jgi:WD40 repeat protein